MASPTSVAGSVTSVSAPSVCPSNTAEAGKSDKCEGCPGQALCKAGAGGVSQGQLGLRLDSIVHRRVCQLVLCCVILFALFAAFGCLCLLCLVSFLFVFVVWFFFLLKKTS